RLHPRRSGWSRWARLRPGDHVQVGDTWLVVRRRRDELAGLGASHRRHGGVPATAVGGRDETPGTSPTASGAASARDGAPASAVRHGRTAAWGTPALGAVVTALLWQQPALLVAALIGPVA